MKACSSLLNILGARLKVRFTITVLSHLTPTYFEVPNQAQKRFCKFFRAGPMNTWLACPKRVNRKFTRLAAFNAVPIFFYLFCPSSISILWRICLYVDISDSVQTVHELPLLANSITLQWNLFTQIRSGSNCWPDIYYWGTGLAVTGRIYDIGQNIFTFSFSNRK